MKLIPPSWIYCFVAGVAVYGILVTLFPPYVIDEYGHRHGTMPLGAIYLSGFVSILSGISTLIGYWSRGSRRSNQKLGAK